jgi:hypothetical protein
MIILSTVRYGAEAYGSASLAIFKKLEHTYNRGLKLAHSWFVELKIFCARPQCDNLYRWTISNHNSHPLHNKITHLVHIRCLTKILKIVRAHSHFCIDFLHWFTLMLKMIAEVRSKSNRVLIAASDKKDTKNLKTNNKKTTRTRRSQDNTIPGNGKAERITRRKLRKNRRVPPAGLSELDHQTTRRTTTKKMGTDRLRNEKQKTMKNKEKCQQWDENTKRSGSGQPIHAQIINHEPTPECPFCYTKLTTDHILWNCKETESERIRKDQNEHHRRWRGGNKEREKLINYIKTSHNPLY